MADIRKTLDLPRIFDILFSTISTRKNVDNFFYSPKFQKEKTEKVMFRIAPICLFADINFKTDDEIMLLIPFKLRSVGEKRNYS